MHRLLPTSGFPAVVVAAALWVSTAEASQIISTSSVQNLTLGVNAKGQAMLTYISKGKTVHVLASGAVNATAPDDSRRQVSFHLEYDGGFRKLYTDNAVVKAAVADLRSLQRQMTSATNAGNNPERYALAPRIAAVYAKLAGLRASAEGYWKTFTCPTYTGPTLAWRVAACEAPDGSYWAVQEWQRKLPDYGEPPTPSEAAMEVHLSHWTGALPVITVDLNWAYKKYDHLYGTLAYHGQPVHGFRSTTQGQPLDTYGRNIFVDTFDSAYGTGWRRENSFLTHNPGGTFCYGFYPHEDHPAGTGTMYRATVLGPGVTPDVEWQGNAPGGYSPEPQAAANEAILALDDPQCRPV